MKRSTTSETSTTSTTETVTLTIAELEELCRLAVGTRGTDNALTLSVLRRPELLGAIAGVRRDLVWTIRGCARGRETKARTASLRAMRAYLERDEARGWRRKDFTEVIGDIIEDGDLPISRLWGTRERHDEDTRAAIRARVGRAPVQVEAEGVVAAAAAKQAEGETNSGASETGPRHD